MKCKGIVFAVVSIILLAALCLPTAAVGKEENTFTLRVGYWDGYGISMDAHGEIYGYTCDYMKKIAAFNGWKLEFIACDWLDGLEKLEKGELDVFGPLQKTPEREKLFDYTTLPMGNEYGALYAREDNDKIFYEDAKSMDKKVLGVVGNNYYMDEILDYCAQNDVTFDIKIMDDADGFVRALSEGASDLIAASGMLMTERVKVILRFPMEPFFYPITKGNQFVLDGMNRALLDIQKQNIYYHAELYDRYYEQAIGGKTAFTSEERAFIKAAPVLKIGYQPDRAPVEFYNEKTGRTEGIAVDLLNSASTYSGLKFEYIKTDGVEDALQKLHAGELDFMMGVVESEQFAREHSLRLTTPLLSGKLIFILKQGSVLEDQPLVLAIPKDWSGTRAQMEKNYPVSQVKLYDTQAQCLDALLRGDANIAVQNAFSADKMLKPQRYRQLSVNSMRMGDLAICLAAAETAPAVLLSTMNKAISSIDEKTRNQFIYRHTVGQPYVPSFGEMLRYNAPLLGGGALLAFALLLLFSLRSSAKLNRLAYYDPLTGEMNLNKFKLEAQRRLAHPDKGGALMVVDIDKFKSINDLYGYEFGDRILRLVAKTLREHLPQGTLLCHGVADKFYLFFDNSDQAWLSARFDLFSQRVEVAMKRDMPGCNIVLSAGVCAVQTQGDNVVSIIDRANIASKQVKSYHESSLSVYDRSMYDNINRARTIENEMSAALESGEFVVYLQPKIQLSTRKIVGAEALVRWQHPQRGLVPPGEFIPLFEENGFVTSLDYYVLERVCALLGRWKREGRACFTISVNLSRRHLQNERTAQRVLETASRYDVDPQLIELELTESAFDNRNLPDITALFDKLHEGGFTVSVDDFGSGYSSLSLLKDLPIDVLKIDRTFLINRITMTARWACC